MIKNAENGHFVQAEKSHYFGKMPNFAGLWCLNHMTHRDSWGIIGKIIFVAFIWYLVVLCVTASLVTIASWKSGLILSSLKMLISVLSNKAVLGFPFIWQNQGLESSSLDKTKVSLQICNKIKFQAKRLSQILLHKHFIHIQRILLLPSMSGMDGLHTFCQV